MTHYRAQVELERDTAQAEDRTVNSFWFTTNEIGTPTQELDDIVTTLTTLYNAIDGSLSRELSGAWRIKIYDMEDPTPRVPVRNVTPTALVPGSSALPSQVALIVNYSATPLSGTKPARQRGRHFVGPLTQVDQDLVGESGASSTIINAVGNAYAALVPPFMGATSGSTLTWQVFSRRDAYDHLGLPYTAPEPTYTLAALNAGTSAVDTIRIPNVYGVQRRRRVGSGATSTTFT